MEDHESGKEHFAQQLERTNHTCEECGFEGAIPGSEWEVRTHKSSRSGQLIYELECPSCESTKTIETTLNVL